MLQELSVDRLLRKILSQASVLVDCDRSSIFLVDEERSEIYARIFDHHTQENQVFKEVRIPKDTGIAGHVLATGMPVIVYDAYQDPRFNPTVDQKTGYRTKNVLAMPLFSNNKKVLGVVQFINKISFSSFTRQDLKSAEIFSHFAGLALTNAQLYDNSVKSEQRNKVALSVIGSSL